jgi:iron complex outermembrane receptor protein
MHVRASYWRVVMENRIIAPLYSEVLRPDSPLAERVVRALPDSQDLLADQPGRVSQINLTRLNYGGLETSGIDFDTALSVERPWGCLKLDLAATWIDEYLSRDMNPVLPVDRVGIANAQGTVPQWRVVGGIAWKRGNFGVSTTTTFVPSYQDADLLLGPLDRRIGSLTTVDLQTWLELNVHDNALVDGSKLTLGARNLFDATPDFSRAGGSLGHDFSQGELTGRFLYLRLSKLF